MGILTYPNTSTLQHLLAAKQEHGRLIEALFLQPSTVATETAPVVADCTCGVAWQGLAGPGAQENWWFRPPWWTEPGRKWSFNPDKMAI